ncbi:MAG: Uma2 family endonuclease [Acidobacteriota bacterium]
MSTTLVEVPVQPSAITPPRKKWTRAECSVLDESEILVGQRLELIDGELLNKMGKNRPHVICTMYLTGLLIQIFGVRFIQLESPIDIAPEDNPTSEPEPDIVVLKRELSEFCKSNPQPDDIHLLVEVSDSTLYFDLTTKASLYAQAGIADFWILDITGRRMIVHREPQNGKYASVMAYSEQESVTPLGATASIQVSDAFPA